MALRQYLATEIALDHAEGTLTRRQALRALAAMGFGAAAASSLLAACGGDDDDTAAPATTAGASATTAAAGRISGQAELIRFAGPNGELTGAWAAAESPEGALLVVHENRGLTAHFMALPARFAADGYSALVVDLLSEEGGTASLDEGAAPAALANASEERLLGDLRAGLDELERRAPGARLGAVGFCFGGAMVWQLLAAGEDRLAAAVPFYGPAPEGADLSGAKAAVLAIYAEQDARVNASRDAAVAALEAAGLTHEVKTFPGVDHAFFNDTGPRHDPDAAAEAYRLVLDWLGRHVAA